MFIEHVLREKDSLALTHSLGRGGIYAFDICNVKPQIIHRCLMFISLLLSTVQVQDFLL